MIQVFPAILTDNVFELGEALRKIRDSKKFSRVQIDFIDGEYANNRTIKPAEMDLIPYLPLKFDAHLMVSENNVLIWAKEAAVMGFERVIAQMESISEPGDFRSLAIDVHSPVEAIEPFLSSLELVVVMAIEPGLGGQEFKVEAIEKIKKLNSLRIQSKFNFRICVDGGVKKEHLQALEETGADEAVVGWKRIFEMVQ